MTNAMLRTLAAAAVVAIVGATPALCQTEAVVWTNAVGVSVSGNNLTMTAATGWGNAGAVSTRAIASGDGYVEFTASATTSARIVGLSNGDTNQSYTDIDFAVLLYSDGSVQVYESGTYRGNIGTYMTGDVFRVAVVSGQVRYSKNGVVFYTSSVTPTYPLLCDTAVNNTGATIQGVVLSGSLAEAILPRAVVWTNAVGVSVSANNLTMTAATGWGNAGASSVQVIPNGDGYAEVTVAELNRSRMFGLSNGDTNQNYTDIDFGIDVYNNQLYVIENGVTRCGPVTVATGDVLRVAVTAGVVRYYVNSALQYTSTVAPTFPLGIDAALYDAGSTIANAVIFAQAGPPGPPHAVLSAPTTGRTGTALTFDGTGSWDPDGSVVSYAWDFGDGTTATGGTAAHTYASGGPYTVTLTVTDNSGLTGTATQVENISQPVLWKNVVGVEATGNSLTKTAATGWDNGGAASVQTIPGDGYMEFTAQETNTYRMVGLSNGDTSQHYSDIDFAVNLVAGTLKVMEAGVGRGEFGVFAPGDRFRVAVESGAVKYYRNGALFYTSTVAPTFPLGIDTSLRDAGSTITDATISSQPGPPGPPVAVIAGPASTRIGTELTFDGLGSWDPDGWVASYAWDFGDGTTATGATVTHTYAASGPYAVTLTVTDNSGLTGTATQTEQVSQSVLWRNVVGVTASGNSLTKTAATGWNNGGASSVQVIPGDGYMEFTAQETNTYRLVGLSHGDTNWLPNDIDFAVYLASDTLEVTEGGVSRGALGVVAAGDRFRVAVESGVVKYYRNGVLFYTSTVAPTFPLGIDTSLCDAGSTIMDATIFVQPGQPGPPVAVITAPTAGRVGTALTFDGLSSWDPDGWVASYAWDFGDGTTATGAVVAHAFQSGRPHTVTLTVTDNSSLTGTATQVENISQPVLWKNVVGVEATGNSLTKTAATGWDNGGASSVQVMPGDGYMEFTAQETNTYRLAGLSHGDTNRLPSDIDFAVDLASDTLKVTEGGVSRGEFGVVSPGDRFRVAVESGVVKYYQNGRLFYTSAVAPTFPLVIDTSLCDAGSTITDAVICVQPEPGPPHAVISGPTLGLVGTELTFDGLGSWDPDGWVASYSWDFGDGATAAGAAVTHAYAAYGQYTVTLTVTDNSGNPTVATASVEATEPLVVGNVQMTNVTASTATVTWRTNIPSTGVVHYGTTTSYGASVPTAAELATMHTITLTGLASRTIYHFSVQATDAHGTMAQSGNTAFVTTAGPSATSTGGASSGRSAADGITPPGMQAGSPTGSYALSGFESVNLFSGNLSFALPLATIAGRGAAQYTITLPISRTWNVLRETIENTPYNMYRHVPYPETWSAWFPSSYWPRHSPGVVVVRQVAELTSESCVVWDALDPLRTHPGRWARSNTRVAFVSPDGTTHTLESYYSHPGPSSECRTDDNYITHVGYVQRTRFDSTDGSGIVFVSDQPIEDNYSVGEAASSYSLDYPVRAGWLRFRDGTAYRVENGRVRRIVDRNGNEVDLEYPAQQAEWDFSPSRITDSLGRVTTITQSSSADCDTLDTITFGGYQGASRTLLLCHKALAGALYPDTEIATEAELFPTLDASQSLFNPQVVSSVRLPDGREYGFRYSKYGKLTEVTLPTGGVIRYEYESLAEVLHSGPLPFVWHPVRRRVARVASGSDAETLTTTYDYRRCEPDHPNHTHVTATEAGTGVESRSLHVFKGCPDTSGGDPIWGPAWDGGREIATRTMNGAGTELKRTENEWTEYAAGPQITRQSTTLDSASTSVQTRTYGAFGNLTGTTDYDYDGAPIRRTCTQYVDDSSYTGDAVHLISLPKREAVYAGAGGGDECTDAGAMAETSYEYDGALIFDRPGIIHHDGGRGTGYSTRGNVARVGRWWNTNNSWLFTSFYHDIAGNVSYTLDPRGYWTWITYGSEGGAYAFPTRVDRQVDGSNAHTTTATYDFNTGKAVSFTDANGVQSTYAYNDPLERLTEAIAAANGGTARRRMTFSYNDAARTITTTSDVRADQDGQSQAIYDSFGRTTATRNWSGYEWTRVDTQYDALGRVRSVSNPYYEGQTEPVWSTTTQYDALGRVTAVTAPGSATTSTTYSGATTKVTDPEGKKRSTVTDALGRLKSVTEDPDGLGFQTHYTYDALGNLTRVQQGDQARTFAYDSLSRLRGAWNPESGTVLYEYDRAGNLTQREDARGIVTLYRGYDGLNRVHERIYSDGTDAVSFGYDAGTYGKGRLTSVETAVSASSYEYDPAGRVRHSSQTLPGGSAYDMNYTYSQGGLLNRLYYPSGRIAEYGHDAAGRTNQVSSLQPGAPGEFQLVAPGALTYWPNGSIKYLRLWDGIEERFQLTPRNAVESLTFTPAPVLQYPYSNVLTLSYKYEKNGNPWEQHITGNDGGIDFTQNYQYDALNRLNVVTETGGGSWSQTYDHDRFGNRWVTQSSVPLSPLTPTAEGHINSDNNRIESCNNGGTVDYDYAGNLTRDCEGQTFAYDAENRLSVSQRPGQAPISYRYDGEGRRILKMGEAHTIAYVYDASGRLLMESNGLESKDYIYMGSRLLARAFGLPGTPVPPPIPQETPNCPMLAPLPGSFTGVNPEFLWLNEGHSPVFLRLRTPQGELLRWGVLKSCSHVEPDGRVHEDKFCRITVSELTGGPTLVGDVHRWTLDLPGCEFWKFSAGGGSVPGDQYCSPLDPPPACPAICGPQVPCDAACVHEQNGDPMGSRTTCEQDGKACAADYYCGSTCAGTCLAECPVGAPSLGRTGDCQFRECCNTSAEAASCEEHAGMSAFQCLATAGDCGAGYTPKGATADCAQCCVGSKPACVGGGYQCSSTGSCPDDYRIYTEASGVGSSCGDNGLCCVRVASDSCTWERGGDYCSQTGCALGYDDLGPGSDCPGSCCKLQVANFGYCELPQPGTPPGCASLCFLGVPCDAPCVASGGGGTYGGATASDCLSNGSGGYCQPWPNTCQTCQSLGGLCQTGDCPAGSTLVGYTPDCGSSGKCCTQPCVPTGCPAGSCGQQSDGCGGVLPCGECTSCTQTPGNQCATDGACPRGYNDVGTIGDCAKCCAPGPSCAAAAGGFNACLQSGSCASLGNYSDLGPTTDCNSCCRLQACISVAGQRSACLGTGQSCQDSAIDLGRTADCQHCCKFPTCAEQGGECSTNPYGCPQGHRYLWPQDCGGPCCQIPYCGDGACDPDTETPENCSGDCYCGDGYCDGANGEHPYNCHQDCPFL